MNDTRRISFYLMQIHLGDATIRRGRFSNPFPLSTVYICPVCGSPWGRFRVQFSGWQSFTRLCPAHGPGALLPSHIHGEIPDLPPPVLRNEILAAYELLPGRSYNAYLICGDNTPNFTPQEPNPLGVQQRLDIILGASDG